MTRYHNFSAGPCVLPISVLEEAQRNLVDHPDFGMSVMETSHRAAPWVERLAGIEADLRTLVRIPDDYAVLFLQGGASSQFAMVPLNLLPQGGSADYINTGRWSEKAIDEVGQIGLNARIAASSADTNFDRIPTELHVDPRATYLHYTSNNTICGTQYRRPPNVDVPLVCDASSDILSRPLEWEGHDVIFAGAQKNMGPAGVTLVLVRREVLDRVPASLPTMWKYKTHAAKGSMFNTPPVFPIYMMGLVVRWVMSHGTLEDMATRTDAKAGRVYEVIDAGEFYAGHADRDSRSNMNISFRLPTPELDAMFVAESNELGFRRLKGHRSLGGCRASLYNAIPDESVHALVAFMRDFEARRG
jgi:phosphoserine aminotransferase